MLIIIYYLLKIIKYYNEKNNIHNLFLLRKIEREYRIMTIVIKKIINIES